MLYPGAEVSFEYWFVSDAGIDPVCLESEKLGREKLQPVLQLIVDGIGSGVYPAHPGVNDANCTFCVAKTACDTDRERQWLRKREQPELSSYLALVGAHEADESNDAEASE